jgi:glycogen debranching enzyme
MAAGGERFDASAAEATADAAAEASADAPFYVAATSGPSRRRLTIKHNDAFAVLDTHGDIDAAANGADGLYEGDTRFLSQLRLRIYDEEPLLLGYSVNDDSLNVDIDLANPDVRRDGRIVLSKDTLHIARTVFVQNSGLHTRIAVTNHGHQAVACELALHFDSDFSDLFEVRGRVRPRRGKRLRRLDGRARVLFAYEGLDGGVRETSLAFWPEPNSLHKSAATYALKLAPGRSATVVITAACRGPAEATPSTFVQRLIIARRARRNAIRELPAIETSNAALNETINRSLADFYMLLSDTEQGPYPHAGIPWFSATFGRDGLIAAMQMLWLDPRIARGVLKRLAHFQATTFDPAADAEPGKILHEMRSGEMAALREVPFGRYYGSVDSTPLFVMLAGEYAARTGDFGFVGEIWPSMERALRWIDEHGDCDGDGFVEYAGDRGQGLSNQGWKDSHDSIFHADGHLARGPIALVEVQEYVYAAKHHAATCARALGRASDAAALEASAERLRERFEGAFWDDELGTYVLALDGDKRPCRVRTSNAGHALFTGIADVSCARRTARTLLGPAFFSGWGVRTLAIGEARYNPISYHNGSIWPHDNALIAAGLRRYAMGAELLPIFNGLTEAAARMDQRRLPELFCGFPRRRGQSPTLYPVACSPQAWASATIFQLLQSLLGLSFDPGAREIVLNDPQLPRSIARISVRNLRLGTARAGFTLAREDATARLIETSGDLAVRLNGRVAS